MKPLLKVLILSLAVVAAGFSLRGEGRVFGTFPDAHELPPATWTGPVFQLSQNYPATAPAATTYPWSSINFKTKPKEYLDSVLNYARQGNEAVDWYVEKNLTRDWYHAPWMHSGNNGREFVHGLTRERTSPPGELAPTQTAQVQNWAVSISNAPAGYVFGQVWKDPNNPDPAAALFPKGSVSVKLLFTAATVAQVPYLKNSLTWKANIHQSLTSSVRKIQDVRLLQIDVAVRDPRAPTTGWVFGTYVYNGDAPGATPLDRMVFRGLMWGNDPGVTPAMVASGTLLKQGVVSTTNIPVGLHAGWAGRLNGPVDNPISSCMSCHATAQVPTAPMTFQNSNTTTQKLAFFKNIAAGKSFDASGQPNAIPTDYNLQISMGIRAWKAANPSNALMLSSTSPRSGLKTKMPFKPKVNKNPRLGL